MLYTIHPHITENMPSVKSTTKTTKSKDRSDKSDKAKTHKLSLKGMLNFM